MRQLSNTHPQFVCCYKKRDWSAWRIAACLLCTTVFLATLAVGARAQVSPPPSGGELGDLQVCFYECKDGPTVRGAETWQEITTLMLANPARQRIVPSLHFFDGNETYIGRAAFELSSGDLDEVNICSTLQQAVDATGLPVPVPPAGLVFLTGPPGAYFWMKNVTGKFFKDQPEPFAGRVTGIGKVDCRVVAEGPSGILDPSSLTPLSAPINAICVEKTADTGETGCNSPFP